VGGVEEYEGGGEGISVGGVEKTAEEQNVREGCEVDMGGMWGVGIDEAE